MSIMLTSVTHFNITIFMGPANLFLQSWNIKVKRQSCPCALRHEDVWGSGCIDPRFLDLGTSLG
jgi:hypothetical protein